MPFNINNNNLYSKVWRMRGAITGQKQTLKIQKLRRKNIFANFCFFYSTAWYDRGNSWHDSSAGFTAYRKYLIWNHFWVPHLGLVGILPVRLYDKWTHVWLPCYMNTCMISYHKTNVWFPCYMNTCMTSLLYEHMYDLLS